MITIVLAQESPICRRQQKCFCVPRVQRKSCDWLYRCVLHLYGKNGTLVWSWRDELERLFEAFLLRHPKGLRLSVFGVDSVIAVDCVVFFGVILARARGLLYMTVTENTIDFDSFCPIEYPTFFSACTGE